jgi:hypothetical protein
MENWEEGDRRSTDMNKKKAKKIEGEKIGDRGEKEKENIKRENMKNSGKAKARNKERSKEGNSQNVFLIKTLKNSSWPAFVDCPNSPDQNRMC